MCKGMLFDQGAPCQMHFPFWANRCLKPMRCWLSCYTALWWFQSSTHTHYSLTGDQLSFMYGGAWYQDGLKNHTPLKYNYMCSLAIAIDSTSCMYRRYRSYPSIRQRTEELAFSIQATWLLRMAIKLTGSNTWHCFLTGSKFSTHTLLSGSVK